MVTSPFLDALTSELRRSLREHWPEAGGQSTAALCDLAQATVIDDVVRVLCPCTPDAPPHTHLTDGYDPTTNPLLDDAERLELELLRRHAATQASRPQLRLSDSDLARQILRIHKPSMTIGSVQPYCEGCYEAGGFDGAPLYPCSTARLALESAEDLEVCEAQVHGGQCCGHPGMCGSEGYEPPLPTIVEDYTPVCGNAEPHEPHMIRVSQPGATYSTNCGGVCVCTDKPVLRRVVGVGPHRVYEHHV